MVEPATKLKWDWVLDAICEHLEAVTRGDIQNLLANVPPGSMKSLLVGVFWPAWEWGPMNRPDLRYVSTAHEQDLAIRDSRKSRDLIKSDWYQSRWPIEIKADMDGKKEFGNTAMGFRNARSFGSMTGARGDRVMLDDPISAKNANSPAHLEDAKTTFLETLPTRINDHDKSSIVVIMQRLNQIDVSGIILSKGLKYAHLCIPMEYDPSRFTLTPVKPSYYDAPLIKARYDKKTMRWYKDGDPSLSEAERDRIMELPLIEGYDPDPRTEAGELMFPAHFSREAVDALKLTLGEYGTAGQLQQTPSPRGGGILKEKWWGWYVIMPRIKWRMIYADTAQKEKEQNDYSVLQCWGMTDTGQIALLDQLRDKWEGPELERNARSFWAKHKAITGLGPLRQMKVEDKSSGTGLIQSLRRRKEGQPAIPVRPIQRNIDKISRAYSASPQIEAGNVLLPQNAPYITDYISECNAFPAGANDDQIDPTMDAIEDMLGGSVRRSSEGKPAGTLGPSVVEG